MLKSETPQPAAAQPLKEASAVKQIAERIARSAHEGQMEELTGDDYIRHIERVVSLVSGDDAKAVAWLHDVLEDTDVTSAYLIAAGIPDEVRLAVERLTRGDEPYAAYIETIRSSGPMLARVVKVADLRDHLRPNCPERLRQRYEKALAALSEVQPPAAATQEREALREMTSALKGFVEWHGGAHVGPCPEDDACDCPGKPYNDAVNEVIRKADAILKVQPAAAAPQDETLALVNQALTKAGSRHIVGTKDGVIVACTIEEALQPAAAAPLIDLLAIEARYAAATKDDLRLIRYDHGGGRLARFTPRPDPSYRGDEDRELIADFYDEANREFYYHALTDIGVLLARLRALQGTEP